MDILPPPFRITPPRESAVRRARDVAAVLAASEPTDSGASLRSLRQIQHFRTIALLSQAIAVGAAVLTGVALPLVPVVGIGATVLLCNLLLAWRLRSVARATPLEVFTHLAIDLAAFTGLLLLAGGAGNPFVSLYFLHVALMALLLPARLAVLGLVLTLFAAGICARFGLPLELVDGRHIPPAMMNASRWLSFALSAAMLVWFIVRVNGSLHGYQRLLAEAARKAANDETVLRIGTVAAGAAHELATPLTSMSVIVKEWERQGHAGPLARDVQILSSQIAACKQALANLRTAAGEARLANDVEQPLDALLQELAQRCRAMRPGVNLECAVEGPQPAPLVLAEAEFKQAVLILLNNAADACPEDVRLTGRWDDAELDLAVADRGAGIPAAKLALLGRIFFTTKAPGKGTGLGLMLTASTVDRLGGTVRWFNRPDGGACAHVRVPLSSLQRNANEAYQ